MIFILNGMVIFLLKILEDHILDIERLPTIKVKQEVITHGTFGLTERVREAYDVQYVDNLQ